MRSFSGVSVPLAVELRSSLDASWLMLKYNWRKSFFVVLWRHCGQVSELRKYQMDYFCAFFTDSSCTHPSSHFPTQQLWKMCPQGVQNISVSFESSLSMQTAQSPNIFLFDKMIPKINCNPHFLECERIRDPSHVAHIRFTQRFKRRLPYTHNMNFFVSVRCDSIQRTAKLNFLMNPIKKSVF